MMVRHVEPTVPGRVRGFTLIELLVVIAIIALLVAILMPTLNEAKDMARTVACQTNLSQMGRAMRVYAADFGGTLCYDTHLTAWGLGGHGYGLPKTPGHIRDYLDGTPVYFSAKPNQEPDGPAGVMYCPAYKAIPDIRGRSPYPGWEGRYATCFQNMGPTHIARSYRINDWFAEIPTSHNWNKTSTDKKVPKMTDVRAASKLVLFSEGWGKGLSTGGHAGGRGWYLNPKHGDRCPAVRADGSVKLYTEEESVAGGILWSPNNGIKSSYQVETWGTYLHPGYTKSY
ncbi:MAG: type II secretion system protein [Planctomycetota bacterium]